MLHTMKSVFAILCLFALSLSTNAQQMLTSDITVTYPIYYHKLGGSDYRLDPATHNATLRFFSFGKYFTYEIELSGPVFKEANQSINKKGDKRYFSWSGSTDFMSAAHITSPNNMYVLADAQKRMDGLFGKGDEGWMVIVTGQLKNCITDIHSGSTLTEVQTAMKGLGQYTSFKETGTVGSLKEYTVYGFQLDDHPIRNQTTARKDDPYAKFYFNANNVLVKWYMLKR